MIRNQLFVMVMLVSCAVLTVSCKEDDEEDASLSNRDACEIMGQCMEDWYSTYYDDSFDLSGCVNDVEEESSSCAAAFRDVTRCLDREDCNVDDCESQVEDMDDACDSQDGDVVTYDQNSQGN